MCHGPLRFCNDLHVLKVDPYHVDQPLKQFWSCLNDWNLFSIVGQWLLKNVIYDLWKSASPEAFYSPLFAVLHYFFDRVYIKKNSKKCRKWVQRNGTRVPPITTLEYALFYHFCAKITTFSNLLTSCKRSSYTPRVGRKRGCKTEIPRTGENRAKLCRVCKKKLSGSAKNKKKK